MAVNLLYDNLYSNMNEAITQSFVLNKEAQEIRNKEELISQLEDLSIHGINTPLSKNKNSILNLRYRTLYLIPVFQQKILGFYRQTNKDNGNWLNSSIVKENTKVFVEKIGNISSSKEKRRVTSQAIRAVYALNLDYGLVKVGVTAGNKPWILLVNPFPNGNDEINTLFEHGIKNFNEKWDSFIEKNSKNTMIGADPEFVLRSPGGQLVLASQFLSKHGIAGCDQIWINRDRSQLPIAELRPKPSNDLRELLINLYKSMLYANKRISNKSLHWLAGAMPITGHPIGGHIHFSNSWLNSFLLRALDNYLTLLITLFEDDEKGRARRPKYGFLGDYREKPHGGFEYRTLPSWLVSPTLTKGVFALAKLIVENYPYLYQNPLRDKKVQKDYYYGRKSDLRPIVYKLWAELKQLSDYSKYEKYLAPLEELIINGYTWNENEDFKKAWYLPPYHTKFLNQKK